MMRSPGLGLQAARIVLVTTALVTSTGRLQAPVEVDPPLPIAPAPEGRWHLQMNGWYISVDGAEVELPSLSQQTLPAFRPRGPQPLSPYDHLIAYHAEAEGLDWRLVAAVIFEESRFDENAVSDKGAFGLMQVRPIAAAEVGSRSYKAPSDNIRTGSRYLKQLAQEFDDAHGRDRLALVLAAYNMGPGHVKDAQALARRVGYVPTYWRESMELVLPLLEEPAIHQQLPNGYAQGRQTVAYVNRVLAQYDAYRRRFARETVSAADGAGG